MKRNTGLCYNKLPMEGAYNVRDLGGYATKNGSVTRYHQFLRSDNLTEISSDYHNYDARTPSVRQSNSR